MSKSESPGKLANDTSFTLTAADQVAHSITVRTLLSRCLIENDRRMNAYDARLLRPQLVPTLVRWALRVLPKNI